MAVIPREALTGSLLGDTLVSVLFGRLGFFRCQLTVGDARMFDIMNQSSKDHCKLCDRIAGDSQSVLVKVLGHRQELVDRTFFVLTPAIVDFLRHDNALE